MTYVVLYAALSGLSPEEADAFTDEAAELGLDVDDLAPRMSAEPETIVLLSTGLAALFSKLAEMSGADAGHRLAGLLGRLTRGHPGRHAIEDRQLRITFRWDEQAQRDSPAAAAAMITIGDAIGAIPDGTELAWDARRQQWLAAGR